MNQNKTLEINNKSFTNYAEMGKGVRRQIVDMIAHAGRGHIASAFSIIEILLVLYYKTLRVDPKSPHHPDRDRFILSKGHGALGLYPVLSNLGFFPSEELMKYCSPKGILGGHPEHLKVPGVEASTGSLGHGLSIGIGMALAARLNRQNYNVYVLMGDGECNEGSVWEGALAAAKHNLDSLIVLVDYNKYQSYARVSEVLNLEPFTNKWEAFGFDVHEANLDHPEELEEVLNKKIPSIKGKPHVVICHTIKGKGVSFTENDLNWHHKAKLSEDEVVRLRDALK